jgi:hypothetical protein
MSQIALDRALAVALAAFRANGNNYVKTNSWYNGMEIDGRPVEPNLVVAKRLLADEGYEPGAEDLKCAEEMREHFKGLLLKKLTGEIKDGTFFDKMIVLANRESISKFDLGIVCYMPGHYFKELKQEHIRESLEALDSSHFGQVGEKVKLDINLVDYKILPAYNSYLYTAKTGSNIVKFFSKADFRSAGGKFAVSARVKSHTKDKYGNLVTELNYVKTQ